MFNGELTFSSFAEFGSVMCRDIELPEQLSIVSVGRAIAVASKLNRLLHVICRDKPVVCGDACLYIK